MQEESPEGGRFKKEIVVDGQSYLLLIRDEGGPPELQVIIINESFSSHPFFFQFTSWVDAVIFVFSLENETSFNAIYNYYAKMAQYRNIQDVPLILVGTQGINSFPILFPVIVCEHHFCPVKLRLKTFLLSEDRFQYKGTAHSKLTRPAWWYLILWIISA